MSNKTNQAQKEALMKGSPWLKDLMLNPHLNKFMKDFEEEYKYDTRTQVNTGRFSIKVFEYSTHFGESIQITLNNNHIYDGDKKKYDKINVFDLILRYACLHKGTILHIAEPGTKESILFCHPTDVITKGKKESTFFDLFYLCKHRTKVEDKKHHEFTKYHNNNP